MKTRTGAWLALLGVAGVFLAHAVSLGLSPQDDAFISFRYARNLLAGNGLVFNPGERVEGYTNFLWTVLQAPVIALGVDPVQGARALGCLAALAILVRLAVRGAEGEPSRTAGANALPGWIGIGAGLILGASSSFAAEAVQGLETVLFALLVTGMIFSAEGDAGAGRTGWLTGALGGLAALTRPEGVLVLLGISFHRLLPPPLGPGRRAGQVPPWRAAATALAIGLAIAIPYRLLAWGYYGQPLPNTFYAKVGGGWSAVERGAGYGGSFAMAWLPVLTLAAFGLAATPGWRRTLRGGFVLTYAAYVIAVGGDYKGTFRFFVPVMPITALLAAEGAAVLARQLESRRTRAALGAGLVMLAAVSVFAFSGEAREFSRIRRLKYETDRLAGQWFDRNLPPEAVLATSNAGIIPYFANRPTIDMLGLTDLHIAHVEMPAMGRGMAGHEKGDGAYVYGRRPAGVLFMQTRITTDGPVPLADVGRRMNFVAELQLWQNRDFHRDYEWVSVPLSGYTLNYFRRRVA